MKTPDVTKSIAQIKAWKKQHDERPKELALTFGEQDNLDVLSYAGLEEQQDHLCIDGVYIRTLFISGYPFVASSGWFDNLINFNHNADISCHVHEVDALQALPQATGSVQGAQFSGGFTQGAQTISLLGLDPGFTLFLIDC